MHHSRYGYMMLHNLLKVEDLVVSNKHTYRLYTEEGLPARTKKHKKLHHLRLVMELVTRVSQRWSMGFVSTQLNNGRDVHVLNVIDDFSRSTICCQLNVQIKQHEDKKCHRDSGTNLGERSLLIYL